MNLNKRTVALIVWVLVLWIAFNWAMYELFYPTSNYPYGIGSFSFIGMLFWNLLVVGGGLGLFFSFRKSRFR